jgi:hypothetical protein
VALECPPFQPSFRVNDVFGMRGTKNPVATERTGKVASFEEQTDLHEIPCLPAGSLALATPTALNDGFKKNERRVQGLQRASEK